MDYGNHFYITLFSNASPETCPNNTLAEFTVQLAQRIDLGSIGSWDVDIAIIFCDLIRSQFVGSQYTRCLRTLTKYGDRTFDNVYYLPVEKHVFQDKYDS
jgi:hypothetical protein